MSNKKYPINGVLLLSKEEITNTAEEETYTTEGISDNTEENTPVSSSTSYVANKNTKKFHYLHCSSVDDINPSNRWDFEGSRDELINQGYVPFKRCNP